jgi:hypothetical protein
MIRCKAILVPGVKRLERLLGDVGEEAVLAGLDDLFQRLQVGTTEPLVRQSELEVVQRRLDLLELAVLAQPRKPSKAPASSKGKQRSAAPVTPASRAIDSSSGHLTTAELAALHGTTRGTLTSKVSKLRKASKPLVLTLGNSVWRQCGKQGQSDLWQQI